MTFNIITLIILGLVAYTLSVLKMFIKKLNRGEAIIRSGTGGTVVSFDKLLVLPSLHNYEIVDISIKKLTINAKLKDKDLEDVPLTISLLVRLNTSSTEVFINTVNTFGAPVVSDANFIFEYFNGKAIEAVQKAVRSYSQEKILHCDSEVKEKAIQNLLPNIPGFVIEDLIITTEQMFEEA